MIKILHSSDRRSIEKLICRLQPHRFDEISETVRLILQEVAETGDKAVAAYTAAFDGVSLKPEEFELRTEEIERLARQVEPELQAALETAAARIESFHRRQLEKDFEYEDLDGVKLGQRVRPLASAGIYVPGGKAVYPSTVLMNAIPARVAGVREIVMVSPPRNGVLPPAIIAAAKIAGVHRIFRVGGAQAIAALAFGTAKIPAVDKIVGPGNRYVAEAKRQLFGLVDIDMFAGPSEVLIIADSSADPRWAALDMLAQAEHDEDARAVLLTNSEKLAKEVREALRRELKMAPRAEIIEKALSANSALVITDSLEEAARLADRIAPEHLQLMVREPAALLEEINHAGSVFLGSVTPVACGDYLAGPNHVLPTMGTARFFSPLGVYDFLKRIGYMEFSRQALEKFSGMVVKLAETEGLAWHARSIAARLKK